MLETATGPYRYSFESNVQFYILFIEDSFYAHSRSSCDNQLLASSCLSVCPFIHMKLLGGEGKDFREILYWGCLLSLVDQIQVRLK